MADEVKNKNEKVETLLNNVFQDRFHFDLFFLNVNLIQIFKL